METPLSTFSNAAKGLSRGPLGIIALFIVLVYGFASLVTFSSALQSDNKIPLVYFLVLFPVLVLGVFAWLVSKHANKLYPPSEFKNEDNFVAVVASLAAASVGRTGSAESLTPTSIQNLSQIAREAELKSLRMRERRDRVLWVDDRPENNVYVRQAFETVGIECVLALSTSQALSLLEREKFAAIISDMGRKEGSREGYVLLDALRQKGDQTPYFVYAGSNLPEHTAEVLQHGGQGNTNHAQELFKMVSKTVLDG